MACCREMMQHPKVDVDVTDFEPLLSATAIAELEREYGLGLVSLSISYELSLCHFDQLY
jgi:hypothetical protein